MIIFSDSQGGFKKKIGDGFVSFDALSACQLFQLQVGILSVQVLVSHVYDGKGL